MGCRNCLKYNGKACELGLTLPCGEYVPHISTPLERAGDLISRSKAKEDLLSWAVVINKPNLLSREDALTVLDFMPAVDAVPVVRCKDCKHYMTIHCTCDGCCISDYWYCADGERKDNG